MFYPPSIASVAYQLQAVRRHLEHGEQHGRSLARRLGWATRWAHALSRSKDPFPRLRGRIVKAYRSALDNTLQPYSLYVPPGYTRRRRWPLYVMLHGMHCNHRQGLHQMLGTWMAEADEERISWAEFLRRAPAVKVSPRALVLAPQAYGDAFYHHMGEVDVLRAIAEVSRDYRVDPRRVILVGHSMGGTGVLDLGLRFPRRFAGMVSLAGYPSRYIHGEIRRGPLRAWERRQVRRYSPLLWVRNGRHVPLIAVHGTRDGAYRAKGLVQAYNSRRYGADLKLFEFGHAVWRKYLDKGQVYADTRGWRTPLRPRRVTFRTTRLRWNRAYWIRLDSRPDATTGSSVDGRLGGGNRVTLKTKNVDQLTLRLDSRQVNPRRPMTARVDGTTVTFPWQARVTLHRSAGVWRAGAGPTGPGGPAGLRKTPGLEGPVEDIHYGPVLVVYGTRDTQQSVALKRVAHQLSRYGLSSVRYPVKADTQITPADRRRYHLILVGSALANHETARYQFRLPIKITRREVRLGACRFRGADLGVKYLYPNPDVPDRYLLVVAGTTALGVLRQHLLPRYLPDFVVYDRSLENGQNWRIFGPKRSPLAAGTFDHRWRLPRGLCRAPRRVP